jgi:hypothetical protein
MTAVIGGPSEFDDAGTMVSTVFVFVCAFGIAVPVHVQGCSQRDETQR